MPKEKRASRRSQPKHATSSNRRKPRPLDFAKSSWTIRFKTESELRERLEGLMTLVGRGEGAGESLEAVSGPDSCLSLIQSVHIVGKALAPKTLTPTEKLGDTYLTSQERELFKARAVKGVTAAGCQIDDTDVPAEEATTHSAVVGAIRDNAHG